MWALSPEALAAAEEGGQALEPLSDEPDITFRAYEGGPDAYASTIDFLPSSSKHVSRRRVTQLQALKHCRVQRL